MCDACNKLLQLTEGRISRRERSLRDIIKGLEYREKAINIDEAQSESPGAMSHNNNGAITDTNKNDGGVEEQVIIY